MLVVDRRDDASVARVPDRLGISRSQAAAHVHAVGTATLHAAGCLPWHGSVACLRPIGHDAAPHGVGRWGEALVRNYLLATLPPGKSVHWLNESEETRAPYDLTITPTGQAAHHAGGGGREAPVFVEVKTTRYADHNVFELTYREWEFLSREPPVTYRIFRVSGAADPANARISIIEAPLQDIKEGRLRLCVAV